MEVGEQLLASLKDGRKIDSLLHGIEGYLMPVSKVKSKMTSTNGGKYGAFAMKMLRACIERLSNTKPGSQDLASILQISEQSYQCVCQTRKHIKAIPLALEKLLFHTMAQTLNKRLLSDAQRVASALYDELSRSRSDFLTDTGVDNEYDTIVKQAFNKLWKACLDLEQSSQGQHALKHALILNVRLQALQFLMLTDYESSWVVERALRSAVDFDRKSSKSASDQEQLNMFLNTVLDLLLGADRTTTTKTKQDQKSTKAKTDDTVDKNMTQVFELGLQAVKYSIRAAKFDQALQICDKLDISLQSPSKKDYIKQDSIHGQCVMIIKAGLQIKQHMRGHSNISNQDTKNTKLISPSLDSLSDTIQSITTDVSKVVEKTTIAGPSLTCLLESCEILKKSLGGSSDSQQQQKSVLKLPDGLLDPIYGIMMLYVDLLQVQKEQLSTMAKESRDAAKSQGQQIQRNVNRQLNTLDFLSTMWLDKIKSHSGSSSQDRAAAADKEDSGDDRCLEKAVQVCHKTKAIIDDVASGGGGALPAEENRWFGSSAYNLGLVCYKRKSYCQATFLLDIACNQLQTWCFTGNKLDKDKIAKVQLLSRYELLIGCQRKANQPIEAMQTTVKCLWDLCSHVTDQVTPCIELWVKAKRDALKKSGNEHVQSRTLFDAIKDIESNLNEDHRDYISLLLKKELQTYKTQRHDTTVEQHSVVCDMLSLNSSDDTQLAYCHALVEQAQLLRMGNFESDKSSCECCSEAIDILTELAEEASSNNDGSDNPQGLIAFDVLATAYFWMYVCQIEESQLSNTDTADSKSEEDSKTTSTEGGVVPHVAFNLGMEQASMQYLDMALGIWDDIMCNGYKSDAFHDLSITCQCLKLMSSVYELTQRPLQQLQSLRLLSVLSTSTGNRSQSVHAYCQLSRMLCHLGQIKLAGSLLWKAEEVLASMEEGGGGMESEGASTCKSLELSCMLAKAEYLLYDGQFNSFQSKLDKLIQSQTSERRTYQTYLHNACIKQLQATSTEVMTPNLCPDGQTSLGLAVEAMRIRTGVCSNLLGENFCSRQQQGEGTKTNNISTTEINVNEESYDQWSILSAVLQSLLQVGKLYCQHGCVREAEGYLYEGLVISNKYLLPRRCAEFSLQLSKVYTMKGQLCQAQLNQMKQFVNSSKDTTAKTLAIDANIGKGATKAIRRISSRASIADNSEDDDFIQSKRLSLTDLISADDVTCSPTLKSQTIKLPAYHQHGSECGCQSCTDVVLHQCDIEYFVAQARSSLMQGELLEASTEVDTVMRFANWIVTRDDKMIQNIVKTLSNDGIDTDKKNSKQKKNQKSAAHDSCSRVHIHDQIIFELKALKIQVLLQQNKPMKAQQSIDSALRMFTKDISPVILPDTMKAELQYYQVITNMSQQGCDVYTNAWKQLQNQSIETMLSNQLEDLSLKLGKLDLTDTVKSGKGVCGKPSVAWQDRTDVGAGRPELARKDLVTPMAQVITSGAIGIFCDPSDDDDGDETKLEGACAIENTPKPARTKSNVQASTKKGILSYSVKKKSQKIPPVIWEDQSQEISHKPISGFSLDNDVFGFDSPSLASKKSKSVRKTKSAKAVTSSKKITKTRQKSQRSKVTFAESDSGSNDKASAPMGTDDTSQTETTKSSDILVFSLDNDVDFEQESSSKSKSKSKSKRKTSKPVMDIDYEEKCSDKESDSPPVNNGPPRKSNARTGTVRKNTARKGSTARNTVKKPSFVLSESDADETGEQPKVSNRRKKKSESSQDDDDKAVKPKGKTGKKLPVEKEEDDGDEIEEMVVKKPSTSRPRRGRRANIENARADDDDDLEVETFDIMMEENCILPVDSSPGVNISDVSCQSYSDLDLSCDTSNKDTSTSETISSVDVTIRSTISDMLLLEDVEEIEIPRAGPDSEEEDVSRGARRKKSTASKKATGRKRLTKQLVDEDEGVEMLRASTQVTEELSSRQRAGKTDSTTKQQLETLNDSDLAPVIQQLEQIYNTIKQSAPVILYRQVCHMLALCHGDQSPAAAVYYLNEAMSITLRHKKVDSLTKRIRKAKKESASTDAEQLAENLAKMSLIPNNNKNKKKTAKNATKQASVSTLELLEMERNRFVFKDVSSQNNGSNVVQETLNGLPEGWTICMLSIVAPGVYSGKLPSDSDFLAVSRLARNKEPLLLKVPMQQCDLGSTGSKMSSRNILEEFDAILVENKESVKETDKKIWWSSRQRLDARMETLTKDMESSLFGCWKGVMLGQSKDHERRNKLEHAAKELKTAIKASCEEVHIDQHLCECLLASANKLSKHQLTIALSRLSKHKPGSEEHMALMTVYRQLADKLTRGSDESDIRHPVILILDKQIQQLPWENMPIVKDQPMCRMPSLHFIQSHLKTTKQCGGDSTGLSREIQQDNTFFVLNPSNDLANTQKMFRKWFEKDNGWKGVVARAPTKEEYMSALTDHDLFVYCGHGNGREFLTGDDIQRLNCKAATLLIGCSSGKLHVNGCLEANGMALNYLLAGCPCVVANLWDVTDRDIDRFLEELLKSWLNSDKTTSLPDYINQARQSCKLQNLIGCSPVVYGLPVHIK